MKFKIVTPQSVLFDGEADMAIIPGAKGEFGVLDRHEPLIAKLMAGSVRLYKEGTIIETFPITDGFAEVNPQGCIVMGIQA